MGSVRLVFALLRVNQWVKNLLVFAAPAGAGVLFEGESLLAALLAFVAFSLTASALYIVNDIIDVDSDRLHPRKMNRPIASGRVSVPVAVAVAVALLMGSAVIAGLFLPAAFWLVLMAYVANTILYTWWGKHVPIVDVMQVALGFVLRAVAGAEATVVPLSQWFMAAAMFGSLLMVAGKRSSELAHVTDDGNTHSVIRS